MKYIVYKTTCSVNNKIYIGVHQTENPQEFDGYLGNNLYVNRTTFIKNPKFPFHWAVKKYGIENFKRETLYIFNTAEEAYKKEAELVNSEFVLQENNYNIALGGKGGILMPRKVYQFDLDGNLLREYVSAIEASKTVEISVSNINDAIHNKRTSANSLWSDKEIIDISEFKITKPNIYYIYDSNGNYIKSCNSSECVQFLNTDTGNLSRAIKLNNRIKGYFISVEKLDSIKIQVTKLNGKLNRYTLDGKYIDSFDSVKQAKEILGLKLCSISQAIKLNRQCNGFRWTRTDNPTPTIII